MAALDAVVLVLGPDGERGIPLAELHRLPGDDPSRDTTLEHGELITAIELPPLPLAGALGYRKVRDRPRSPSRSSRSPPRSTWRTASCATSGSRSAGSRTSPGAPPRPRRRCAGGRPTEDAFATAADAELAAATRCATTASRCRWRATSSSARCCDLAEATR